ncbi:MAG: hypothetical protein NTU41_14160, partial [Chloroflexi bacterium]|nr:hypothetical protein [Chloroflexota bacterium]
MKLRWWWGMAAVAAILLGFLVTLGTASADNTGKGPIANLLYVQYETPSGASIDVSALGTGTLCSDYSYGGIHWANPNGIKYWINPANSGVAANTAISALSAAFATWDNACGSLSFSYQGTTTLAAGVRDYNNVVSWEDLGADSRTVALATFWYAASTKEIVEVDTQMNSALLWSYTAPNVSHDLSGSATPDGSRYSDPTNSGVVGKYDIQNIMTHEAGHWLNLSDLYSGTQSELTMYGYGATGELKKDTLAYGDELGVEAIYPTIGVSLNTSGLVSSYPITIHYQQGGVAKTDTTYGAWSSSVDYGSTLSIDNTVAVSSTERYSTTDTTSWTVTELATYSVTYYHQFKPAISAVTAGTGHADLSAGDYATLTYYRFGSAGTFNVFDAQSFSDWVDAGSTASLSNTSSASISAHRWYASGTTSWIVTDASSRSATYWEQFKPAISVVTTGTGHTDLSAGDYATLTYYRFGSAGTFNVFDAQSFRDWVDAGSTA